MKYQGINDDELVTLKMGNGEIIDFVALAGIPYKKSYYVVLQPVKDYPGVSENEAFVFEVTSNRDGTDCYTLVLDDNLLEKLHVEYEKLLDENGIE